MSVWSKKTIASLQVEALGEGQVTLKRTLGAVSYTHLTLPTTERV